MNSFLKQLQRGRLLTALLALLLAAAIAFLSIGIAAWESIASQISKINQQYTTIAVPAITNQHNVWEYEHFEGELQRLNGLLEPDNYSTAALNAPQLLSVDRRYLLSAYTEGQRAMSSGALDPLQYRFEDDCCNYNLTVLAVKCVSVIEELREGWKGYTVEFEFIDAPSRLECYDLPYADINVSLDGSYNKDGSIAFEEGKTYLIRGFYHDFPIYGAPDTYDPNEGWTGQRIRMDPSVEEYGFTTRLFSTTLKSTNYWISDGNGQIIQGGTPNFILPQSNAAGAEERSYYYFPEEGLPFFAEYTGDWRDFLETPEGRVWRDEIIPMCERNQHSAAVILTDSLQSMYAFNTGTASVMEGRAFTPEEYFGGAPVCLVSASYAILNNLQVGDTINLDFYNTGYIVEAFSESIDGVSGISGGIVSRLPMVEENRIGVKQDYTIVGVYSAPEFAVGVHNFHADTIFVPKASVPDAGDYEDPYSDYLNTYILENGTADEFEAYMAENGFGGSFWYFDQDFSEIVSAMESLRSNARRLLALGVAAFVLAAALFVFLSLRRMAPTARGMRLMGVKSGLIWRELMAALAVLTSGSAVLGGLLGAALYGFVTGRTLSGSVAPRPGTLALCAAGAAMALLAASALCALPVVRRKLMQSPKKGK